MTFAPRFLLNGPSSNPMIHPFSDLTKDFDPERRKRIEQHKSEIRQCFDLPPRLNFTYGSQPHVYHRHLEDRQP